MLYRYLAAQPLCQLNFQIPQRMFVEKYGCKELAAFNNKPSLNYKQSTNTEIVEFLIKDKNSHYYEDQDGR